MRRNICFISICDKGLLKSLTIFQIISLLTNKWRNSKDCFWLCTTLFIYKKYFISLLLNRISLTDRKIKSQTYIFEEVVVRVAINKSCCKSSTLFCTNDFCHCDNWKILFEISNLTFEIYRSTILIEVYLFALKSEFITLCRNKFMRICSETTHRCHHS